MPTRLPPETFPEVVLRLRRRAKLSATELGKRVGREGRSAVEAWERGKSLPEREAFPLLARELGVPVDTLLELAGLEPDESAPVDPVLSALADQAADMERRLRALAATPPPGVTPAEIAASIRAAEVRRGDPKRKERP